MSFDPSPSWDDLLEYIDDGRVVPIIGWDVLRVEVEGRSVCFDRLIAERLAERIGIKVEHLDEDDPLNSVVCQHVANGGQPDQLYMRVRSILREKFATPAPLRELAGIGKFTLFVTTTFDSLVEQAINEERFGGAPRAASLTFSLSSNEDLPREGGELSTPTVYHLLGRSTSTVPDCVLTQEHMLEYFHRLQHEGLPERLFDKLRQSHLLLIGNRLSDWLLRFLIRIAKGDRLVSPRGCAEILANSSTTQRDGELVTFLRSFSRSTQVFDGGDAVHFIAELSRRYKERHPAVETEMVPRAAAHDDTPMPEGAVFLSYAHEDLKAVERIHEALEEAGIDAWMDKSELLGGDEYDLKIRRCIRNCSVFVPIISRNTQERVEGYFRQEWNLAVERSMRMDDAVRFIVPVVIDDTPENDSARVPDRFYSRHWMRQAEGNCEPGFLDQMRELVRAARRRQRSTV